MNNEITSLLLFVADASILHAFTKSRIRKDLYMAPMLLFYLYIHIGKALQKAIFASQRSVGVLLK